MSSKKKNIEYNIVKHFAVISEGAKGWKKEVNSVSWNGDEPKFDIRSWSPDHEKMGKGITMTENEMISLWKILDSLYSDSMEITLPDETLFEELGKNRT